MMLTPWGGRACPRAAAFLASSAASSSNHTTSDEDSFFGDELQMPVGGLPRKPRTADISIADDWDEYVRQTRVRMHGLSMGP